MLPSSVTEIIDSTGARLVLDLEESESDDACPRPMPTPTPIMLDKCAVRINGILTPQVHDVPSCAAGGAHAAAANKAKDKAAAAAPLTLCAADSDNMTLETASVTVDDWTTASSSMGTSMMSAYSSRGYSSGRSSLTSSSRRSSLTSAMSGGTSRRGSVQSSICSYDDLSTVAASRRGSTASEISNDGTALTSATGATTASTRRRRLFFGLVTTVEFDKHEPANRRLHDGPAKVSHPTEARWDSTPVVKRKLLSSRRRKSGVSSSSNSMSYDDGRGGAPSIPTRSSSFPSRGPGDDRRSSIEIKRPRRRMSVEQVATSSAAQRASSSSLSNFLIPLEISSVEAMEHAHASSRSGQRRGSSWIPRLPRRRGSIEQPHDAHSSAETTCASTTMAPRPRRLNIEMAARRASLEMPVVVEEESDELEMSAPFVVPQARVDGEEDDSSVATLSVLLEEDEKWPKLSSRSGADGDNANNDSSYSSCLTDTSSSSRNAKEDLNDKSLQQEDDSDHPCELGFHREVCSSAIPKPTPSRVNQMFADESAEIVTSVPFSGGAATRRRRLSLVDKVHLPTQQQPTSSSASGALPPTPPARQHSGARRGSFLTNLFASISFSSSGSSSEGTREFPHERSVPATAEGGSSTNPNRRRSLLRSSHSPRLPRRVPSDGSSPSDDGSSARAEASRTGPATDRPCRQPARRSSLLGLLQSFASRIEVDLEEEEAEGPVQATSTASSAALSSSSLPKQPRRRPSNLPSLQHPPASVAPPATRRSSWQLLAIEKPHKSENDVPTDRSLALPESPPRAASEPSRRGSLLGMLLFFRTSSDEAPATNSAHTNNSTASSTDESDEEPSKAGPEPPRRRDGIKPAPFLRRHASCDGRFETIKAPTSRADGTAGATSEVMEGVMDDDADRRRSSMVMTLPSRKMALEPNHPLYRIGDNGQQATISTDPKGRGGRRRWSLISNLPGRRSIAGGSRTGDDDTDGGLGVAGAPAASVPAPLTVVGARSCSDSALLVT